MTENMTVVRYNDRLEKQLCNIADLKERYRKIGVSDVSGWTNQVIPFTRQLWNMLILAEVMTTGALLRNESRGAHYKPEFPDRDDANFLKTTVAEHTPDGPKITYESVDISLIKPRPRKYTADAPAKPAPPAVPAGVNGAKGANGQASSVSPAVIPGEETVSGGLGKNDPLATAPAGTAPRGSGSGTENSKTAPNAPDLEPGKGGAN
jgi:hypothetical protein